MTGGGGAERGVATRRAPLGPRLTCALHRVDFMQPHTRAKAGGSAQLRVGPTLSDACESMHLAFALYARRIKLYSERSDADGLARIVSNKLVVAFDCRLDVLHLRRVNQSFVVTVI